jgi:mRNA-degrading endonuclease RelE of RelBE toxin-antitoxin system
MSYGVALAPEALEDLARLPPEIRSRVEQALARLAGSPTALSRPSHFPYLPAQAYELQYQLESTEYFVTILFRYAQDEQNLVILAIPCLID